MTSVNAEGKPVATKRRFDDLVQLHEDLKRRFRGCVVPFRPGKTKTNSTVIMSHGEGFLKERAFAIKCYLNKVVQHPDMKSCEVSTRAALLHQNHCMQLAPVRWRASELGRAGQEIVGRYQSTRLWSDLSVSGVHALLQ